MKNVPQSHLYACLIITGIWRKLDVPGTRGAYSIEGKDCIKGMHLAMSLYNLKASIKHLRATACS